jgi:predicted O-methyltransferase YrrM
MAMGELKRKLKNQSKRGLRKLFELGQRAGVDILPRHFYSGIPDIRALRQSDGWSKPRSMIGINGADTPQQLEFVRRLCTSYRDQLDAGRIFESAVEQSGEGYGQIESEVLYCFMRSIQPRRVVQVGCGLSTAVMLRALADQGTTSQIVCIDPYPNEFLKQLAAKNAIQLIALKAQDVELSLFQLLSAGDLLFIDSTHTVGPGSEVNRMILEVLPRLSAGCYVHFHDIYFPYDYGRDILDDALFFWNESVLLMAALSDNPKMRIRASMSMLHYAHPDQLCELLPHYRPMTNREGLNGSREGHFPSSIYLERM